mmetsp:Transcript_7985/g.24061  ORF Transcript_7985/g.24061 Transcript_7985/m.24061 type:complete len:297 (+) Transcript_7985:272-1162(+)|eukprot:CAMPEP_0198729816 /NCGR_PEP_ID=MMETSP1475-20131203/21099_1 /TAXON_ID= ORGANISM="Unidentified sp., Strain CCMP1999" /NCGR_SAMPLE_ID=MMETSP1475 /ASSEMBLY_ACC=CAM_ASM_001111 /LENGTH=296 /DNA_ID=CAMNT_0044492525 /DNA_START=239 /DNA_END=1129 /DNA_ORIENTATION=+
MQAFVVAVASATGGRWRASADAIDTGERDLRPATGVSFHKERQRHVGPVIVPGKFDALHLGHRELAHRAAAYGDQVNILTFPGMAQALGWTSRKPVCAPSQRTEIFSAWSEEASVPIVSLQIPFDDVRKLQPEEFVDRMISEYKTVAFVCGTDWKFGYRASGNIDTLRRLCAEENLRVDVVEPVIVDGEPVSSTRVRAALQEGDVGLVRKLLGRPHRLVGLLSEGAYQTVRSIENMTPAPGLYVAEALDRYQRRCGAVTFQVEDEDGEAVVRILEGSLSATPGMLVSLDCYERSGN